MRSWWFLVALGIVTVDGSSVEEQLIDVAVLLPIADVRRPFSAVRVRPAVDIAVRRVSAVLRRRLRVSYGDSDCSEVYGMSEAIDYFVHGPPNVYFGPICDWALSPVARQTTFWNIPVVSVGALDLDFLQRRRVIYPLLTRAGPVNLAGLTNAILAAMTVFDWRRVTCLYDRNAGSDVIPSFCHLTCSAIYYLLEKEPAERVARRNYYKFDQNLTAINVHDVLVNEVGHDFAGK